MSLLYPTKEELRGCFLCRVIEYTLSPARLLTAVFWVIAICVLILVVNLAKRTSTPNIVIRKIFHFAAAVMFAPVVFVDVSQKSQWVSCLSNAHGLAVLSFVSWRSALLWPRQLCAI